MANEIMDRNNLMRNLFKGDSWMNNFPSIFDNSFPENPTLRTDIKENDQTYKIQIDLPAADKKNIDITYDKNILTISGHRDSFVDHNDKNGDVLMSERSSGHFTRQYRLPHVNRDNIKATYNNGVLEVILPKMIEESNSEHHIEIE